MSPELKTFFPPRLLVNLADDKISHSRCFHGHSRGGWHSADRRQMGDTAFPLPWRISSPTLTVVACRSDQKWQYAPFLDGFCPLPPAGPWQQLLIPHDLIQVSALSWSPLWLLPTPSCTPCSCSLHLPGQLLWCDYPLTCLAPPCLWACWDQGPFRGRVERKPRRPWCHIDLVSKHGLADLLAGWPWGKLLSL